MRSVLSIVVMVVVLVAIGASLAGTSANPAQTTDPAATTEPVTVAAPPSVPASLEFTLSSAQVTYGDPVAAHGTLAPGPPAPGESVVLERDAGGGMWLPLATSSLDYYGGFSMTFDAEAGGLLRVRAVESGALSAAVALAVVPAVRAPVAKGAAFHNAKLKINVQPASYNGKVTAIVRQEGRLITRLSGRIRGGRLTLTVPTPGIGPFWVELSFPAADGLSEHQAGAKVIAVARTLSIGATGPEVRALRERLAELHVYVPGPSATFSQELYDSVVAFQKAYGVERTGVADAATWQRLARAQLVKPRYRGPSPHIEVDKTRQVLLVVERGAVMRILPVSTGATGNTPEGHHQIRWKAPATSTWLGSGILYRTMTFVGNSFAIHGWYSVPTYPASHGCVRIPIWMADWIYNRSPVGETVYVYR